MQRERLQSRGGDFPEPLAEDHINRWPMLRHSATAQPRFAGRDTMLWFSERTCRVIFVLPIC